MHYPTAIILSSLELGVALQLLLFEPSDEALFRYAALQPLRTRNMLTGWLAYSTQ